MGATATDPTATFEYEPPNVDTGWPGDSGYESSRRRAPDSGWRMQLRR